jgi:hypothetical protein
MNKKLSEAKEVFEDRIIMNISKIFTAPNYHRPPENNQIYYYFYVDDPEEYILWRLTNDENQEKVMLSLASAQISLTQNCRVSVQFKDRYLSNITVWP